MAVRPRMTTLREWKMPKPAAVAYASCRLRQAEAAPIVRKGAGSIFTFRHVSWLRSRRVAMWGRRCHRPRRPTSLSFLKSTLERDMGIKRIHAVAALMLLVASGAASSQPVTFEGATFVNKGLVGVAR